MAEGACYLLSKDSVLLFPAARLTWHPSLANVCPELKILFAGERARSFGYSSAHLFTPTSVLKLKIPFQIFSDEKALFLVRKALANHLASFLLSSPPPPPFYFIRATIMAYIPFSVQLIYRLWSAGSFVCPSF